MLYKFQSCFCRFRGIYRERAREARLLGRSNFIPSSIELHQAATRAQERRASLYAPEAGKNDQPCSPPRWGAHWYSGYAIRAFLLAEIGTATRAHQDEL